MSHISIRAGEFSRGTCQWKEARRRHRKTCHRFRSKRARTRTRERPEQPGLLGSSWLPRKRESSLEVRSQEGTGRFKLRCQLSTLPKGILCKGLASRRRTSVALCFHCGWEWLSLLETRWFCSSLLGLFSFDLQIGCKSESNYPCSVDWRLLLRTVQIGAFACDNLGSATVTQLVSQTLCYQIRYQWVLMIIMKDKTTLKTSKFFI